MAKMGRSLERLVELIERALGGAANVSLETPGRLVDQTTGRKREFDVLVTLHSGHHIVRIAYECRDRSRPVGVPQVEAYEAKCRHCRVNQGIMVSASGFRESALRKAEFLGIRCYHLQKEASFEWLACQFVTSLQPHVHRWGWSLLVDAGEDIDIGAYEVVTTDGSQIPESVWQANAARTVGNYVRSYITRVGVPPTGTEPQEVSILVHSDSIYARHSVSGMLYQVRQIILRAEYTVRTEVHPFQLLVFGEVNSQTALAQVAVSDIAAGGQKVRLVLIEGNQDRLTGHVLTG